MFNAFKYQFEATFLREENGMGVVRLQSGAVDETLTLPKALIPKEVEPGQSFHLSMQPREVAEQGQYESMRRLLENLIQ